MIKVSIIVPIYNTQLYLKRCLDSLINQTLKDIEIICINDGSTDKSLDILKTYQEKDERIKIIDITNHGVAYARNKGIEIAVGEFIGFCDSDDYVDLDYFETLYNYSIGKEYDIIRGIRLLNDKFSHKKPYGCIVPSIIRRAFLIKSRVKFPENKKTGEDSTFKRWLYNHTHKIFEVTDTKSYYHYVIREGSLSDYKVKPLVSIILTLYEIKPEFLNECIESLLKQTYTNIEIIAINDCSPKTDYDYLTKKYAKVRLIKNEVNLGMNKSVNKAFTYATGKYIVRLGSDDIFEPTMIEEEVEFLETNDEYGAVCCELLQFGTGSRHIKRPRYWVMENILKGNLGGTGYAGGMMFRSSLLSDISIDENFKMCEDFDFHLQILKLMPIGSIHKVLYHYRSHDTNLCKSVKTVERKAIIERILQKHKEINGFVDSDENSEIDETTPQ